MKEDKAGYQLKLVNNFRSRFKDFCRCVAGARKVEHGMPHLESNGRNTDTTHEAASMLAQLFHLVLQRPDFPNTDQFDYEPIASSITEVHFPWVLIESKLLRLKLDKAAAPDSIPNIVLTECADELAVLLAFLFIIYLRAGQLPTKWKLADISPIFKKVSRYQTENYHPVALLITAYKIMESLISDALNA